MASLLQLYFLSLLGSCLAISLRNGTEKTVIEKAVVDSKEAARTAPCQCEANNPYWKATTRTATGCIFIDLGAADGNSFQHFLRNGYGDVSKCTSWSAFLVEANPQFTPALSAAASQYPNQVHVYGETAAYVCQGSVSFSIDPDPSHNHWGSSMKRSYGSKTVTVPTINVIQLVAENTLPGDWVIFKVDIEGAEYDVIPCLAQFAKANLIDIMLLEEHPDTQTMSIYTPQEYINAKNYLKTQMTIPDGYHSSTLLDMGSNRSHM